MPISPLNSHGAGYPLGLTGATAATRYVGATTTGAPVAGTFAVGDFVVAQDGTVLVCTVAGTPGTWVNITGAGGGAPTDATYITQTANAALSAEQALSALATGIVKVTTGTGVLSVAVANTDYQAADADLTAIAALVSAADKMPYATGAQAWALADLTAAARTVLDDATVGAMLTTMAGISATIIDAAGDLIIGSAADTAARLARGSGGGVLTANATTLGFSTYTPATIVPSGFSYENFSRYVTTAGAGQTSGTLRMIAVWIPEGYSVSNIGVINGATAESGGTHAWASLYDSSRNLLRQGTDEVGAAAIAGSALHTFTLTSAFVTTYTGLHYIGLCIVATTMPTLQVLAGNAVVIAVAPILGGNTTDTGLTATAPNPAAAITASANTPYVCV